MIRRRVAYVAFAFAAVAFVHVAGCSYDWKIGSGSVDNSTQAPSGGDSGAAKPPGTPATDGGAVVDAATPRTTGECGPVCECKGNQTCQFTCTTGSCSLTCSNSSDCKLTCAPGATCDTKCEDNADCNLDCRNGHALCDLTCNDDATCKASCSQQSVCTADCSKGCDVNCINGGICRR